jgi:hypothetical protein
VTEQASWIPLPRRRRVKAAKLPVAIERANRMIDWYEANRPSVNRLAVTPEDYKAFEEGVGQYGIYLATDGVKYRSFVIYTAP